jgi:hypothetical protein
MALNKGLRNGFEQGFVHGFEQGFVHGFEQEVITHLRTYNPDI